MSSTETAAEAAQELFADVSPGWQRWDAKLTEAARPASEAIIAAARIAPGMQVLDVATGTGEPALTIVPLVGPQGHVTATDVVPAMVAFAEAKAKRRGLPNISFRVADAADLPFDDSQFDAVTSRMGVMFFPRERALAEILRVLRAGGRAAFTAWGRYDVNPWLTSVREPVVRRLRVPPSSSGGPDVFRYAVAGTLAAEMERAGFRDVEERPLRGRWSFAGTPKDFWTFQSEIGGAMTRPGWDSLTEAEQASAEAESLQLLEPFRDGDKVAIPIDLILASGSR